MISLDDLEINNYKIYQDKDLFCFGMDAVLLSNFVIRRGKIEGFFNGKNISQVADLCTGNIPIPLILHAKSKEKLNIDAFEINAKACEMGEKTLDYNSNSPSGPLDKSIKNNINIINIDLKELSYEKEKNDKYRDRYDLIICNPPYIKKGSGIGSDSTDKLIARSEEKIDFDIICDIANFMLKSGKRFFIVHRPNRLAEIISILKKYNLEPKFIEFVYTKKDRESNLFLLEARKDAKEDMKVLEPIIIYDENNEYTREVLEIYGK